MGHIVLRPVMETDLEMIMNWRMQPEITKYMNTDPKLTIDIQKKWYEKIKEDENTYQWIIEVDSMPVGVTGISDIDKINERCTRGIYIAVKEKRSLDLIVDIYSTQFDFIFYQLKLNKIEVEVFKENRGVVKLNKMCGFIEEGIKRQHIKKNGKYYDMVMLGMTKEDWENKKKTWKYNSVEIIV